MEATEQPSAAATFAMVLAAVAAPIAPAEATPTPVAPAEASAVPAAIAAAAIAAAIAPGIAAGIAGRHHRPGIGIRIAAIADAEATRVRRRGIGDITAV